MKLTHNIIITWWLALDISSREELLRKYLPKYTVQSINYKGVKTLWELSRKPEPKTVMEYFNFRLPENDERLTKLKLLENHLLHSVESTTVREYISLLDELFLETSNKN